MDRHEHSAVPAEIDLRKIKNAGLIDYDEYDNLVIEAISRQKSGLFKSGEIWSDLIQNALESALKAGKLTRYEFNYIINGLNAGCKMEDLLKDVKAWKRGEPVEMIEGVPERIYLALVNEMKKGILNKEEFQYIITGLSAGYPLKELKENIRQLKDRGVPLFGQNGMIVLLDNDKLYDPSLTDIKNDFNKTLNDPEIGKVAKTFPNEQQGAATPDIPVEKSGVGWDINEKFKDKDGFDVKMEDDCFEL